jgi:hypothetical protein
VFTFKGERIREAEVKAGAVGVFGPGRMSTAAEPRRL